MNDASDSKEVRLEINIGASPETVFALLTDPTQMKTWLAEMVEATPSQCINGRRAARRPALRHPRAVQIACG